MKLQTVITNPIDIVMVAVDNLETTRESVESLFANTQDFRLIAIDNESSEPATPSYLQRKADVVVRNNKRVSLAEAWNQGVHLSRSDIVVVTNNDILYAPGWLPPIMAGLRANLPIGVLQPHNTLSVKPEGFPNNYKLVDSIGPVPKEDFVGCCFAFTRDTYDKVEARQEILTGERVGGFDRRLFPFGVEDADFYDLVRELGLSTVTHFGSYVHHWTGRTMNQLYTPTEFHAIQDRSTAIFHEKRIYRQAATASKDPRNLR